MTCAAVLQNCYKRTPQIKHWQSCLPRSLVRDKLLIYRTFGPVMSIKLFPDPNSPLHETFNDSNSNLKAETTFKKAVATTGTWIFYTYANFNGAQPGASSSNYKVLEEGHEVDIGSVNGSMYLVEDATEGFILFEHAYYGGHRKYFRDNCPDVNPFFQHGTNAGVSSAINLTPHEEFLIYTKTGYGGLEGKLERNRWYPTPSDMNFPNDTLQSIRKE